MSCVVSSLQKSCEGIEDVVGGFGPTEWFGVPVFDPVSAVGFERLDVAMGASGEQVAADVGEESFNLIDPTGIGRGEIRVGPRMLARLGPWKPSQPAMTCASIGSRRPTRRQT